jgi:hypothetical protein
VQFRRVLLVEEIHSVADHDGELAERREMADLDLTALAAHKIDKVGFADID